MQQVRYVQATAPLRPRASCRGAQPGQGGRGVGRREPPAGGVLGGGRHRAAAGRCQLADGGQGRVVAGLSGVSAWQAVSHSCPQGWHGCFGGWHSGAMRGWWRDISGSGAAGRLRRLRHASHGAVRGVPRGAERGRAAPGAAGARAARAAGGARGRTVRGRGTGRAARPQGAGCAGARPAAGHGSGGGGAGRGCPGPHRAYGPLLLVPVPSARRAVRARGHDPARRIALAAAGELRRTGTPARVLAVLRQRRAVADQSGLDSRQRLANLAGALEVAAGGARLLAGRPGRAGGRPDDDRGLAREAARAVRAARAGGRRAEAGRAERVAKAAGGHAGCGNGGAAARRRSARRGRCAAGLFRNKPELTENLHRCR